MYKIFTYKNVLFKGIVQRILSGVDTIVLYPGKGVCADPVNEGAMLGKGGPSPHSRDRERQLAPDIGRGEM